VPVHVSSVKLAYINKSFAILLLYYTIKNVMNYIG
jgi:hypothetical protein